MNEKIGGASGSEKRSVVLSPRRMCTHEAKQAHLAAHRASPSCGRPADMGLPSGLLPAPVRAFPSSHHPPPINPPIANPPIANPPTNQPPMPERGSRSGSKGRDDAPAGHGIWIHSTWPYQNQSLGCRNYLDLCPRHERGICQSQAINGWVWGLLRGKNLVRPSCMKADTYCLADGPSIQPLYLV